jgi:hypothetical protein
MWWSLRAWRWAVSSLEIRILLRLAYGAVCAADAEFSGSRLQGRISRHEAPPILLFYVCSCVRLLVSASQLPPAAVAWFDSDRGSRKCIPDSEDPLGEDIVTTRYLKELTNLHETYEVALRLDVEPLRMALKAAAARSAVMVGSGGSFSVASYAAFLHQLNTGRLASASTPLLRLLPAAVGPAQAASWRPGRWPLRDRHRGRSVLPATSADRWSSDAPRGSWRTATSIRCFRTTRLRRTPPCVGSSRDESPPALPAWADARQRCRFHRRRPSARTPDRAPERGVTDGMRVDTKGNLYETGPGGVWIISPEGKHLGTVSAMPTRRRCTSPRAAASTESG